MKTTPKDMSAPPEQEPAPERPSRVAEFIAALYVALLLLTPWLLRDASLLTPPSRGVEIQMSNRAAVATAPVQAQPTVAPQEAPRR